MDIVNTLLPIVFIIVGIALIWFVVELALTMRKTRTTIVDLKNDVDPIIANANQIVEDLQPAIEKVDPLVGRVQLTVDSANLELMRVDQILEDVTEITDSLSSASNAVDKVTQVPVAAVEGVSTRLRDVFKPRRASNVSRALGEEKETGATAAPVAKPVAESVADPEDTAVIPAVSEETE